MKKQLIFSLILSVFLIFVSCDSKDPIDVPVGYEYPVSAFNYTGNDGPAPVDVQFNNYSETIYADSSFFTWTFGENGPQSHEKNPKHTFYNNTNKAITVLVNLNVLDLASNLSQNRSVPIVIQPAE
ncbi:MAG: hypothetical protein GQ527_11895 [Bacteroidales bacterium]|nr:hypothetical protein [Bacteroidales bacterium]